MRRFWSSRIRRNAALCCAILLGVVGGAGPAGAASPAHTVAAAGQFNFDTGNAAAEVFIPRAEPTVLKSMNPADATLVLRLTTLLANSWFDAIAPYHPTAVGIYSDLGRRPASEAATNRNKNIAILYATYRVLNSLLPQHSDQWRAMLAEVGLDPDDNQENRHTAVGIGNLAGNTVMANRVHDGMNQLGDESGRKYNGRPYADYLGYQPVNTAYELRNPSRWQPDLVTRGDGIFQVQQFVTPQLRVVRPYTYTDPRQFLVPPPRDSDHRHRQAYKRQADQVLAASAALTDERKMKSELFNNKFLSLGLSTGITASNAGLNLDRWVQYHLTVDIASFDTAIAVWHNKTVYDAVRPFSAIRYLYGNQPVTAWGGPGKGTVTDLPGNQWRSYLQTADHPEYPSGSASFCSAHSQAARRFLGTDRIDFAVPFAPGASQIEPGVTPAAPLVLHFGSWTEFTRECGLSRFRGGVHFLAAVTAGFQFGPRFGDRAYEFVQRHISGAVGSR